MVHNDSLCHAFLFGAQARRNLAARSLRTPHVLIQKRLVWHLVEGDRVLGVVAELSLDQAGNEAWNEVAALEGARVIVSREVEHVLLGAATMSDAGMKEAVHAAKEHENPLRISPVPQIFQELFAGSETYNTLEPPLGEL